MSQVEQWERQHLAFVQQRLHENLDELDVRLQDYANDVQSQKEYLWDSKADMDHVEKVSARESIQQSVMVGGAVSDQKKRLLKLRNSPYFGRFDFQQSGTDKALPIYIGVHHFHDEIDQETLVYDWRAPVSSLFYDYETGQAHYETPGGRVDGLIERKRQFRIRNGKMEFMLESDLNIMDDLLQETLSQSSDDGMKQIVATIQRDQNAIIRDEDAHSLIIQGVAGSGKTSIALHRIAFLLYRFKDTLSSSDILIISPNPVFSSYIANVLPELGEESVPEMGMDDLAEELLDHKYRFQTFFEQTSQLVTKDDPELQERIRFKSSPEFLRDLSRYAAHVEKNSFQAEEIRIRRRIIPDWFIDEQYRKQRNVPQTERIARVVQAIETNIGIYYHFDITTQERGKIRDAVKGMIHRQTLRETYLQLFDWMERPDLIRKAKGGRLEHADVFPLIYLKMELEGLSSVSTRFRGVKHLLIDEMQDYSAAQYAVINRLFKCRKTILGDSFQSVNPYSASKAEEIQQVLGQATSVTLTKSYRSTQEIMEFAQKISPNPDLVPMARHGQAPELHQLSSRAKEFAVWVSLVSEFEASDFHSMGVICKTQKQAEQCHRKLQEHGLKAQLLEAYSSSKIQGVIVCTAHMAKGLEFDQVLIPDVSAKQYSTLIDRNMLYVACTRAMHRLDLTTSGLPSEFLEMRAV